MLDHELQKARVEVLSAELCEFFEFSLGENTRHHLGIRRHRLHVHHRHRARQIPRLEPITHHGNLIFLRKGDPQRHELYSFARTASLHQRRHLESLSVVHNHALHEFYVRIGVAQISQIGGFLRCDLTARLARCARLNDGHLRASNARRKEAGQDEGRAH